MMVADEVHVNDNVTLVACYRPGLLVLVYLRVRVHFSITHRETSSVVHSKTVSCVVIWWYLYCEQYVRVVYDIFSYRLYVCNYLTQSFVPQSLNYGSLYYDSDIPS